MISLNTSQLVIVDAHFDIVFERLQKSITYVLKNGCTYKKIKYTPVLDERAFLNTLNQKSVLKGLVTASPDKLALLRRYMLKRFPNIHFNTNNLNRLLYKIFVSDGYNSIDKHAFISKLEIDTCPYCNRNYVYSLSKSAKIKPELDHFYPKSIYPYFGVSFYNLIPSCQTCNGLGVKGETDPFIKKMVSPYLLKEDDYEFTFDLTKLDYLSPLDGKSSVDVKFLKQVEGNVEVFKLDSLYKLHSDHVLELIVKSKVYYNDKYREYLNNFEGLSFSDSEIDRVLIGNYTSLNELHKRPFSKLYRDIALELGLIV
ncbi:hypothetical protein MC378_14295 [Polaribacter sp. MSW13]|uniref:HNH endonuclease n=1 Tax=Polaribacter marinus TaxID=2916838 RepID=A0A9X1VQB4_9FLAO|nr:hypothetical protein [Polaribacter marinus]MCI2230346.1 hypothetical protein [Polaribacter marinus]